MILIQGISENVACMCFLVLRAAKILPTSDQPLIRKAKESLAGVPEKVGPD